MAETPNRLAARLAAWSGLATVSLFGINLLLLPLHDLAASNGSPNAIAHIFASSRTVILIANYLGAMAWGGSFLVFVASLYRAIPARDDSSRTLAAVGLVGGVAESVTITVVYLLSNLVAFRAAEANDLQAVLLLHEGALLANNLSGFATAVCLVGFSGSMLRAAAFPAWVVWLGVVVAALHLLSAGTFAHSGPLSPAGAPSAVAPLGMSLWIVCVSGLLLRR